MENVLFISVIEINCYVTVIGDICLNIWSVNKWHVVYFIIKICKEITSLGYLANLVCNFAAITCIVSVVSYTYFFL